MRLSTIQRLRGAWRRSGLLSLLAMAALLAGCAQQHPGKTLSAGFSQYQSGSYASSNATANEYIQKYGHNPNVDEAYYLKGISCEARGDLAGAEVAYRAAIACSKRPDLTAKSYRSLGDMAYMKHNYSAAVTYYEASISSDPSLAPGAWLLFRLGAALQSEGQWSAARIYFARLLQDFPTSPPAQFALERINMTHFALQYAAFTVLTAASREAAYLHMQHIPAVVVPSEVGGRWLYLVQSGDYPTWAMATAEQVALKRRFPQVIVVP
ncbi:MAG: tetratricopeptide repeat protein [Phycisphaerales bacterium]|nr:tetratricopeptide repeat protein [Phycisphaerales bacterium]